MKKILALILTLVFLFSLSLTAFAAESPVADQKVKLTFRKADGTAPFEKEDVTYTVDKDGTVTLKADEATYGKFDSWSVYKVVAAVEGTNAVAEGTVVNLSQVVNLAATTKVEEAKAGTDYDIVKGSLTTAEITVKLYSDVIVCANYNGTITNPLDVSNADSSSNAPATGDMTAVYFAVIALAVLAFGVAVKKQYSK